MLPWDHPNGWLAMLSAYFDDSGTHQPSEIVLLAGILGTEWQHTSLERLWRKNIQSPLDGAKPRLKRFHMAECQASDGEFEGWSRTETDYFCHLLETAIIDSHVHCYVFACARKDWDEMIVGRNREIFGDAERACVWNCFVRTLRWANAFTFNSKIEFIFDQRDKGRWRDYDVIGDAFQRFTENPSIVSYGFGKSTELMGLQAADLVAWEFYQHALNLLGGRKEPARKQFRRLVANVRIDAQMTTRGALKKIIANVATRSPEKQEEMARHLTTFDPRAASISVEQFSEKLVPPPLPSRPRLPRGQRR